VRRMTASIQYNRPLQKGNWESMVLWGRNQDVSGGNVGNSYLLESTLRFLERNYAWTRIENVDRTHYCPAKISGSDSNSLTISTITHGRSKNDLDWKGAG